MDAYHLSYQSYFSLLYFDKHHLLRSLLIFCVNQEVWASSHHVSSHNGKRCSDDNPFRGKYIPDINKNTSTAMKIGTFFIFSSHSSKKNFRRSYHLVLIFPIFIHTYMEQIGFIYKSFSHCSLDKNMLLCSLNIVVCSTLWII